MGEVQIEVYIVSISVSFYSLLIPPHTLKNTERYTLIKMEKVQSIELISLSFLILWIPQQLINFTALYTNLLQMKIVQMTTFHWSLKSTNLFTLPCAILCSVMVKYRWHMSCLLKFIDPLTTADLKWSLRHDKPLYIFACNTLWSSTTTHRNIDRISVSCSSV